MSIDAGGINDRPALVDIEAIRARHANGARPWPPDVRVLLAALDEAHKDLADAVRALTTMAIRADDALSHHEPRTDGTCRECAGGTIYPCPTARALGED